MKTIHKFVLKSYLGPMILTFFIVMFVLLMQFMWRYIDELVGKGLGFSVILEFMINVLPTLIPMGLPLATLLAAIMTMGNMGENYELLAMKSAGMSLPNILKPLVFVVIFVAVASFFVANNLVPYSTRKLYTLIYDIRQQKQALEFKDGIFFNGVPNMSIRVGHQDPNTNLLTDILIYDTREYNGNMTVTTAKSGYIRLSDDRKYLLITLYNGESYEQTRNYQWYDKSTLNRNAFSDQDIVTPVAGFAMEHSDQSMISNSQTKNIVELQTGIDSLQLMTDRASVASYEPFLKNYLFSKDISLVYDSLKVEGLHEKKTIIMDSIVGMDVYQKKKVYEEALNLANNSRSAISFDEETSKDALNQLYRYKAEWHRKMSLPVSIMIFFLIGAPLGAIIRRGGLGMPIVVSVLFFVIYYIISMTGEKLAREGTWISFWGMWFSTFILAPIAIFLTYKATNDSNILNPEWYINQYKKVKGFFIRVFVPKQKRANG